MTEQQRISLAGIVGENLGETDDQIVRIEVKEMADGTGNWAVFVDTIEDGLTEWTFRTVIDADGALVGTESEILRWDGP